MLIMPPPASVPNSVMEVAETKEMEQVIGLYGKVYHFWQVDRGDKLPMGEPKLMMSFTGPEQFKEFEGSLKDRDQRFGVDSKRKAEKRAYIEEPEVHPGKPRAYCEG